MFYKFLIFCLSFIFLTVMISSCGSSRQDDDMSGIDEDTAKQQELDEIEALLGITPEESAQRAEKPGKPKQEDDKLGLLGAGMVPMEEEAASPEQMQNAEKEIASLKSQIEKKDLLINDLKSQVRAQSEQIYQLESQKQSQPVRGAVTVGDVPPGEYQSRYQEGLDLFHGQQYRDAIQIFESLLASSANNSLSDNAQYWIGECHYALREYKKAIIDFEKVFTFPKSNKNDAAQFKLGLCYVRLGDGNKARDEFQRLLDVYPNSDYVARAREHLAEL